VAVDGGCQPAELERLYRRQEQDKANLRVVPFGRGDGQCYRLIWGHFPTKEAADDTMAHLPAGVVARGFPPHVVRVEGTTP
jgi:septal ring-binding cell division protein DamX